MARTGHAIYLRHRRRVIRDATVCALCDGELYPDLPWPHPLSTTADHIIPISEGGSNNGPLRACHARCNQKRYELTAKPVRHGRQW